MNLDIDGMTIAELKQYLTAHGYWFPAKTTKSDLLKRAKEHLQWEKDPKTFDILSEGCLNIIGQYLVPSSIVLLMRCSKKLNRCLQSTFIWQYHSSKLDSYRDLHEVDLARPQPLGFWKNWWIQNNVFTMPICKPTWRDIHTQSENIGLTLCPEVGSLGYIPTRSRFVPDEHAIACWVVVRVDEDSKNKDNVLPSAFHIAPAGGTIAHIFAQRLCPYTLQKRRKIDVRKNGSWSHTFALIDPQDY